MKKNIFTRILAIAFVAMSIMAIAIPAMAETSFGGHTTTDVNIRTSPSITGVYFATWVSDSYRNVETFHNYGTDANREWLKVLSTDNAPMYVQNTSNILATRTQKSQEVVLILESNPVRSCHHRRTLE